VSGMQAGSVVASIYPRSGKERLRRYATDPETARARPLHARPIRRAKRARNAPETT